MILASQRLRQPGIGGLQIFQNELEGFKVQFQIS